MPSSSVLVKNIGTLVTGDLARPVADADCLSIRDGKIARIGPSLPEEANVVIDARGTTVMPGLIDSHSHPLFGDYTPTQHAVGWIKAYLHGGMTMLISAGELHLPGLPLQPLDAKLFKYLAVLARRCSENYRPDGIKLQMGTLLLAPGLREADFDEIQQEGIRLVKFIFYPYGPDLAEPRQYVAWSHAREIKVKIHSGGVSRSGVSQAAGAKLILALQPDIVGHINGGPIPMPWEEIKQIALDSDCYLELARSGNSRVAVQLSRLAVEKKLIHRVLMGTDTPGGTGIIPRGLLRGLALVCSLGEMPPEQAVCTATGNVALAHGLRAGILAEGMPADLVILDRIQGSVARDALDAFRIGDLPGISMVLIDGQIRVRGRSEQTPPPARLAVIEKEESVSQE